MVVQWWFQVFPETGFVAGALGTYDVSFASFFAFLSLLIVSKCNAHITALAMQMQCKRNAHILALAYANALQKSRHVCARHHVLGYFSIPRTAGRVGWDVSECSTLAVFCYPPGMRSICVVSFCFAVQVSAESMYSFCFATQDLRCKVLLVQKVLV